VKRSEELAPLSRDHHQGLFAALKLRRASAEDHEQARATFLAFWADGRRHFVIEEELLLPALARHVPADHAAIVRVLTEHVDLRRRAQDVEAGEQGIDALHELGARLHDHIRHEEDVLFGLVEDALEPDELVALGAAIARAEAA
jgi:hemerythrin-like domain-containing protein